MSGSVPEWRRSSISPARSFPSLPSSSPISAGHRRVKSAGDSSSANWGTSASAVSVPKPQPGELWYLQSPDSCPSSRTGLIPERICDHGVLIFNVDGDNITFGVLTSLGGTSLVTHYNQEHPFYAPNADKFLPIDRAAHPFSEATALNITGTPLRKATYLNIRDHWTCKAADLTIWYGEIRALEPASFKAATKAFDLHSIPQNSSLAAPRRLSDTDPLTMATPPTPRKQRRSGDFTGGAFSFLNKK